MREKGIVRLSAGAAGKGKTDWRRVAMMSEEQIIAAAKSDPHAQPTDAKFWEDARLVMPARRVPVIDRDVVIDQKNVGRIAERIVSNELEARGFRVSDLNREGLAANADLLAVGHDHAWQIQVKGAANKSDERWWVQYGFCTAEVIDRKRPMFNRRSSFYRADIVVLVAVRSPREYRCVVLPIEAAERAAQNNLDREYRTPNRKGGRKKPSKVSVYLEPPTRTARQPSTLRDEESKILEKYKDKDGWHVLLDNGQRIQYTRPDMA